MKKLQEFKQYQLSETADGRSIEIARSAEEVVCLAFDTGRQFFVSMHVLAEDFEDRQEEEMAFHARAAEAKRIRHPNVSVVYEVGEDEGTPYFVTEFVDGEQLRSYLARTAPLPEGVILWLAKQMTEAALAVARYPELLERCDLLECRITSYSLYLSDLVVKLPDPGVAGKRGSGNEAELCALLAEVIVSAAGSGDLGELGGGNLKQSLGTSALGGTLRRMITAVADGEITTLDAFSRGIERCLDDGGHELSTKTRPQSKPLEQLGAQLRSPASIERALGAEFELDFDDPIGSAISGWSVSRPSDQRRYRVYQLPPVRLCNVNLQERIERASGRRKDRYLKRVVASWPDAAGSLYAEGNDDCESVADYSRRRSGLTGDEVIWIASQMHHAMDEANDVGADVWGFGLRGLNLSGLNETGGIECASTRLSIRGHPNLEALTEPCRFSVSGVGAEKAHTPPDDYDAYIEVVRALPMGGGSVLLESALSRFYASAKGDLTSGISASERREAFIDSLSSFLADNGLLEELPPGDEFDAGERASPSERSPGVAQVLFGNAESPQAESWNPIAKSVATESGDEQSIFSDESPGISWGAIILGLLLLLGLSVGALAYFFGWI